MVIIRQKEESLVKVSILLIDSMLSGNIVSPIIFRTNLFSVKFFKTCLFYQKK